MSFNFIDRRPNKDPNPVTRECGDYELVSFERKYGVSIGDISRVEHFSFIGWCHAKQYLDYDGDADQFLVEFSIEPAPEADDGDVLRVRAFFGLDDQADVTAIREAATAAQTAQAERLAAADPGAGGAAGEAPQLVSSQPPVT
jgi:hypothetical protein